jgi:hypothetical protein
MNDQTTQDRAQEVLAKAIWGQLQSARYNPPWDEMPDTGLLKESWRENAGNALAALDAAELAVVDAKALAAFRAFVRVVDAWDAEFVPVGTLKVATPEEYAAFNAVEPYMNNPTAAHVDEQWDELKDDRL